MQINGAEAGPIFEAQPAVRTVLLQRGVRIGDSVVLFWAGDTTVRMCAGSPVARLADWRRRWRRWLVCRTAEPDLFVFFSSHFPQAVGC